jgi:hypothetical protein
MPHFTIVRNMTSDKKFFFMLKSLNGYINI